MKNYYFFTTLLLLYTTFLLLYNYFFTTLFEYISLAAFFIRQFLGNKLYINDRQTPFVNIVAIRYSKFLLLKSYSVFLI